MDDAPLGDPFDPRIDSVLDFPADMPEEVKTTFRAVYTRGYLEGMRTSQSSRDTYLQRDGFLRAIMRAAWILTWCSGFFGGTIAVEIFGHRGYIISIGYGFAGAQIATLLYYVHRYRKAGRI